MGRQGGIAVIATIGNWPIVLRVNPLIPLHYGEITFCHQAPKCFTHNCIERSKSGKFVVFKHKTLYILKFSSFRS